MNTKQFIKLILLSAIWGSSFIFMRILSPAIGPITTSFVRLFIAGSFFLIFYRIKSIQLNIKDNLKTIAIIALVNTSIPFTLYAIAALYVPAGISAITNSMSPMFGMIFSIIMLKKSTSLKGLTGLALGIIGVALITGGGATTLSLNTIYGVGASLIAAMCYGLGSVLIMKYAVNIRPIIMAGSSQFIASLYLIPILPFQNATIQVDKAVVFSMLALALICSALAYLIYYNLVAEIGPTKTLTVTFLIPIFSLLWGAIFLSETITIYTVLGMIIVLLGTKLVVNEK